ncbi:MAG: D-alanyl-D-alanine dipeptidase [candidate division TM6 bacterium GW2011_GWF2_37_49]|nr:MAG: D-alanyl-D-alanine dipeptidase [candidate division TM6 bacterium GW2011_GWF2_37_49]
MSMKKLYSLLVASYFIIFATCTASAAGLEMPKDTTSAASLKMSQEARDKGFVYLSEIDPTIIISPRYSTTENFVGKIVDGYKQPVIILTKQAAEALKQVQQEVVKDGYNLVVYDAYRPQRAVNHFMLWSTNIADQTKKSYYYPRVDKDKVFELGYVAARSGHSRGSTVDLTIIKLEKSLHPIQEIKRTLLDGFEITLLDDGTVDMGSSFDLFDEASHHQNNLIEEQFKHLRNYLMTAMIKHGFKPYAEEWWHYTLKNEPYPASEDISYFDFEIE